MVKQQKICPIMSTDKELVTCVYERCKWNIKEQPSTNRCSVEMIALSSMALTKKISAEVNRRESIESNADTIEEES